MIDAGVEGGGGEDVKHSLGQVAGVGGRADLIVHDADLGALGTEAEHGLDEVVADFGVEPRGAEDGGVGG